MTYQLSLLDKSPIGPTVSPAEALRQTVLRAQRAEQLGYHRYWLAEHHGSQVYAGSAPEVLVSHILAKTTRIRVGTGGVMLQHYSPFKVAEVFKVLASLSPGRVDLGVGKAPGGLPLTTRALQARHDPIRKTEFNALLSDLDAFLVGILPGGHPLAGAVANPTPPSLPERILLGASPDSAQLAARLGWDFCYAGHFNGDPDDLARTFDAYRAATHRAPALALYAHVAATQVEAEDRLGPLRIFKLHLDSGQTVNVPSLEAAAEFARQAGGIRYRTEELKPHVIAGTAERVLGELDALSERFGITEFVLDNPVAGHADRLTSIEMLGQAQAARRSPAAASHAELA